MKTIKPYLFTLLSLFLTSTVFLSCSNENNEDNDLKANQITLEPQTVETPIIESSNIEIGTKPNNLEDNLIFLTLQSIENTKEIVNLLTNNDKKILHSNFQYKLKLCKTENDIADLFEKSNITNSGKILQLIRKQQFVFKQFKEKNPSFYKMDITLRNKLMIEVFAQMNDKKTMKNITTGKINDRRSCADAYNQDAGTAWLVYGTAMATIANETPAVVTGIGALIIAGEVAVVSIAYVDTIAQYEDTYQDCIASNCGKRRNPVKYN